MSGMVRLIALVLLVSLPLSLSAQTFTIQPEDTSTVSYQLQQKLLQIAPIVENYMNLLTPTSSGNPIGTLESALMAPRFNMAPGTTSNSALIATLLEQVALLQTQIEAIIASSTPATPIATEIATSTPAVVGCPNITRTLLFGMRGSDVTELQNYLISENLLSADSASGFFGALTEAAVQAWQSAQAIMTEGTATSTGFGAVGPKTRAALSSCR